MTIIKYAQTISNQSGTYPDVAPYKRWDYLSNLSSANGTAYCRSSQQTDSYLIAGKNGTYKKPCPIDFRDFGFNIDTSLVIEKVVVHYKHQTFENNGFYAGFGGATVQLLGTSVASKTGSPVPSSKTSDSVTFYGVSVTELNSSNFGVRFSYPANSETTPGRIELSDFYVEVFTNVDGLKLSLESGFSKNPMTVGDTGTATFTVKKSSDNAHNATIVIDMPLGVTVGTQTTSNGTVTRSTATRNSQSFTRLTWQISLAATSNSVQSKTIAFNITAGTASDTYSDVEDAKTCTMTESVSHVTYKNKLTIKNVSVDISTNLYEDRIAIPADYDKQVQFRLVQDDPLESSKVLHLSFTNGVEVNNLSGIQNATGVSSASYGSNHSGVLITIDGSVEEIIIPVVINASTGGEFQCYAYVTYPSQVNVISNTISKRFIVRPSDAGALCFARLLINEYWINNMEDGITYTVGSMTKLVNRRPDLSVIDYANNFRIGVFNGSQNVNDETAFLQGVKWGSSIATTTLKENTVSWVYDADNPLYIVFSFTYEDDPMVDYTELLYTEPFIVESKYYDDTSELGHSLWPIKALLSDSNYARGTMSANAPVTIPVSLTEWDSGGTFDQNVSPLGIDVHMNYVTTDPVMLKCTLYIDEEHHGSRDITIQAGSGVVHFNQGFDLFGLKPKDFINNNFNFELRVTVLNIYGNNAYVELNNIIANLSYIFRTSCGFGFTVDGESSRDYGFRVIEIHAPFSTNHEKSEYKVTGTDTTIINRLNIDSKEIKIKIAIDRCSADEKIYLIDKLVEMFTNERELRSNKPIPKELIFENINDRQFPFVRVKEFDEEYKGANYYATITLDIPSGTSYAIDKTITGPTGAAPSTIVLSPDIFYFSDTVGEMVIYEENLNQEFIVQSPQIQVNDTIYMDTANRKVYIQKQSGDVDITGNVDYNSQWFKIKGEYSFVSETGSITSVEYNLRR